MTNQRGALWSRDPPSTNHSSPGDGDHVDDEDVADHGHQGDEHVADSQQDRHGARHLPAVRLFRLVRDCSIDFDTSPKMKKTY